MSSRTGALALVAMIVAAPVARADLIDGSFGGVGTGGFIYAPGFGDSHGMFDLTGVAQSGTFSLRSVAGAVSAFPAFGGPNSYILPGDVSEVVDIPAIGQTIDVQQGAGDLLLLGDDGTVQTVELEPDARDPHQTRGAVTLAGPEGSLFTNILDLSSLHAGPGVSIVSPVEWAVYGSGSSAISVDEQTFASSVPAPQGWAMLPPLAVGAAAIRGSRRRRRTLPRERIAGTS